MMTNLIHEALDDGDSAGKHSVEREEDIIGLDRDHSHGIPVSVLILNTADPEESNIVAAVQSEANNIQRQEVKVQTNHTEVC